MAVCRARHGVLAAFTVGLLLAPLSLRAYQDDMHQELTFLAAKQFNRCVEQREVPRLSALQVRNLVRGNLEEADTGMFRRAVRWSYYDRSAQEPRRALGFIETRLHGRFEYLAEAALAEALNSDLNRYRALGGVIHYLQTVTIPANVVPIVHPRWWRWPAGDRFANYPLQEQDVVESLAGVCDEVLATPDDATFLTLLDRSATATMTAIRQPIADMNTTWQAFWEEDDPGRFGSYGEAGNAFGRRVSFPCGAVDCLLLEDDPIYREFALRQHRLAVLGTMRAILVLQRAAMIARAAGKADWD